MQIKIFSIPIADSGVMQEEMNKFLRGHKVLEVQQELISTERGGIWCFCVRYIQGIQKCQILKIWHFLTVQQIISTAIGQLEKTDISLQYYLESRSARFLKSGTS